MNKVSVIVTLSWLMATPAVYAIDESALQKCRAITDNSIRLQCYDGVVVALAASIDGANAVLPEQSALPPPPAVATTATKSAPMAETSKREQKAEEFGLETTAVARLETIESRIPGVFRGWEAKTKFTFENGQVWQVTDGTEGTYQLENPVVRVERGMFGSFRLVIEGVNRSPKVKRLK